MEKSKFPVRETVFLAVGEIAIGAVIAVVYLLLSKFNYTVITGASLGAFITLANFLILSISVNRTLDKILAEADMNAIANEARAEAAAEIDDGTDTDEQTDEDTEDGEGAHVPDAAERFAAENRMKVQNTIRISYMIRTASMVAALVLALITKKFDLIATLIPLVMFRPLLTLAEITKRKGE